MKSNTYNISRVAVAVLGGTLAMPLAAQSYPAKPVRLIIPFSAGGAADVPGRIVTQRLSDAFKQQVLVDNRPGAGSTIGADAAAKAAPDGHTLFMISNTHFVSAALHKKLAYDSLNDFTPVTQITSAPNILVVHPSLPVKTVKEVIALARKQPGELSYSSSGVYGALHMPMEMFLHATQLKMRHVPTTGGGPALTQLLGGHVTMSAGGPAAITTHVNSGRLRPIVTWGAERHPNYKDVPTFKEQGYDIVYYIWAGLFAPLKTPEPIITRLRLAMKEAMADKQIAGIFEKGGSPPAYLDEPEFKAFVEADHKRLVKAVQAIGKVE